MFELSSFQDIADFTNGCCFFGTGGGGNPKFGAKLLQEALEAGKSIRIVESSILNEETITACPFLMGSSGPDTDALRKAREFYGLTEKKVTNMSAKAVELLVKFAKVKLGAIVPIEVGGAATASAVATAAWMNIPTVDGDYAGGRSLPEICQVIPVMNGLKFSPLFSVDAFGNQIGIFDATNVQMEERLGKLIAGASYSLAGQAGLLMPYKQVKTYIETGTLKKAFALGRALRQAKENDENIIDSIMRTIDAELVIKGKVAEITAEEKDNYFFGVHKIQEMEEPGSNNVEIWFKNEYLQLWLNGQPHIKSPDFICVVNENTGLPVINSEVKIGDSLLVFAVKAPPSLLTQNALKFLSPKYFGFDF